MVWEVIAAAAGVVAAAAGTVAHANRTRPAISTREDDDYYRDKARREHPEWFPEWWQARAAAERERLADRRPPRYDGPRGEVPDPVRHEFGWIDEKRWGRPGE